MTDRPLDPESQRLWASVAAGVRPLRRRATPVRPAIEPKPFSPPVAKGIEPPPPVRGAAARQAGSDAPERMARADTLDAAWDRRLQRGLSAPDRTLDLHGLPLAAAHAAIEDALGAALARGDRLLLLVTGRAPRENRQNERRGAIRASVPGWLAASSHRARIAAVRAAHPRHGGAGALYIVLRRDRNRSIPTTS